ncbi:MAG: DUF1624 domain-containing protein [Oscillospiraceae bacterium]|nr:DUF1624 domain-containing protein [Oscillospiraceae bacterium]
MIRDMKRYYVLDLIRGAALISMIVYHAVWDLVYIEGFNWSWYKSDAAYIWQQSICWTFILLSGFCWRISSKRLKRGIIVSVAGLLVTAMTVFFSPDSRVVFGILTLLGSCMIIMIIPHKLLKKCNPVIGMVISFLLFVFLRNINSGYIGFAGREIISLPHGLYGNLFTAFWGFPPSDFSSSDYFPVLPWILLFITGYFVCGIFEKKNLFRLLEHKTTTFLEWPGRHSLVIYLIHQPVIMIIFYLLSALCLL